MPCPYHSSLFDHQNNTVKPALNGNIFMSREFGAETDVKYPGLNGNRLTQKRKST
jgi:hypothetical protein